MAVAFCIIKEGGAVALFPLENNEKQKTKQNKHSVHRHQSGEWRLPPAECEASSCSSSSVLLQHALDSLVG